jgi:hypothetical protein
VDQTASILNDILRFEAGKKKSTVPDGSLRPMVRKVVSGEVFGLVTSSHNDTFGGLLTIKSEEEDEEKIFTEELETVEDPQVVLADLNIDPALLLRPQQSQASGYASIPITPVPSLNLC